MASNRAGKADAQFGHTQMAYGHEAFNLQDPAFQTGLENAGFEWPQAPVGQTVDYTYGSPEGGEQQTGRFARGGATKVYPSGTAGSINKRMPYANDPESAKEPVGTKSKRYR